MWKAQPTKSIKLWVIGDRELQYAQMENEEKVKKGIVEKSYSDFKSQFWYQKYVANIQWNKHKSIPRHSTIKSEDITCKETFLSIT